jgi:hypothetical protein
MEFIKVGSKVLLAEYKHTSATPPLKLLFWCHHIIINYHTDRDTHKTNMKENTDAETRQRLKSLLIILKETGGKPSDRLSWGFL